MDKEKIITLAVIGIGTLTGVCIIPFSPGIGWAITIFWGFGIVATAIALLCVAISGPLGKLTDAISDRCEKQTSAFIRVMEKLKSATPQGNTVQPDTEASEKQPEIKKEHPFVFWIKKLFGFIFISAILYIFSFGASAYCSKIIQTFENYINLVFALAAIYPLLLAIYLFFRDRYGIRATCYLTTTIANAILILGVSWMVDGFIAIAELQKAQFVHNEEILRSIIAAVDVLSGSLLIVISLLAFKFFCLPKKPKAK